MSKALRDNEISDEEFSMIIKELKKFEVLKAQIRIKYQKNSVKEYDPAVVKQRVREELLKELKGESLT